MPGSYSSIGTFELLQALPHHSIRTQIDGLLVQVGLKFAPKVRKMSSKSTTTAPEQTTQTNESTSQPFDIVTALGNLVSQGNLAVAAEGGVDNSVLLAALPGRGSRDR